MVRDLVFVFDGDFLSDISLQSQTPQKEQQSAILPRRCRQAGFASFRQRLGSWNGTVDADNVLSKGRDILLEAERIEPAADGAHRGSGAIAAPHGLSIHGLEGMRFRGDSSSS
jgi:hypothetical protein